MADDGGFSISVDLSELLGAGREMVGSEFKHVHEAVGLIALQAQKAWGDAIMKAPGIWSEERKQYVASLKWDYVGDNPFHARVTTDYKYADEIENGRPPRDLKVMLNTSLKARVVQNGKNAGKRYLIVPFQHNTPGNSAHAPAMPDSVYQLASKLAPSKVTGMTKRVSQTGAWDTRTQKPAMVPQRKYQWGGRLNLNSDSAWSAAGEASRHHQGMMRFDTAGQGKVKHSTYLTMRVMMEGSPGWVIPAKPGLNLVQGVVTGLNPVAEQVIQMAAMKDLGG